MEGLSFTQDGRRSLAAAREESARLHHEYVGTEHMLLGILRCNDGPAIAVLRELGADLDAMRATIERTVQRGKASTATGPDLPYTSRSKAVLDLAMTAARELATEETREAGEFGVGGEHLLLGMLREEKGIAAQVLVDAGLTQSAVRETILRLAGAKAAGQRTSVSARRTPGARSLGAGAMNGYNFTEGVRRCLANAREEAARLHHEYVGTEHILLGLLKRADGVGSLCWRS